MEELKKYYVNKGEMCFDESLNPDRDHTVYLASDVDSELRSLKALAANGMDLAKIVQGQEKTIKRVCRISARRLEDNKRLHADIVKLKEDIARHFQTEHLAGWGPEIDRWKAKLKLAADTLSRVDRYLNGCDGISGQII